MYWSVTNKQRTPLQEADERSSRAFIGILHYGRRNAMGALQTRNPAELSLESCTKDQVTASEPARKLVNNEVLENRQCRRQELGKILSATRLLRHDETRRGLCCDEVRRGLRHDETRRDWPGPGHDETRRGFA